MRIHYLLIALLLLFLMPISGHGGFISALQKVHCKIRKGRCALRSCLAKEEQIGNCSRNRKCCRKK
ncbi:beta-defensin 103A-like isoform X1 [Castor canadensis]|uniref:Beta-defensin 103-like n=2 Tax=Castor canadensis TaxID=51338 RepID=A0A8C0W0S8_CASCN|nr:beta-defensin 103-like [Castor canadensis]